MKLYLLIAGVALALLAFVACEDSDDSPAATDTPALEATATAGIEPTTFPDATATPSGPDVEGSCPIDDAALCNVAEALERAMSLGQLGGIIANAELAVITCSGLEQIGPCSGLDQGFLLSGYRVGIDASDGISFLSAEDYLQLLDDIAETDDAASDDFGGGAWRLIAIVDNGPFQKTLVTTSIGPDPIYDRAEPERRVFLFRIQRIDGAWQISILLTTVFIQENLTGLNADGTPVEGWLPWGE